MLTKTKSMCFVPVTKPKKFKILDIITGNQTDLVANVSMWSYPEPLLNLFDFMAELLTRVYGSFQIVQKTFLKLCDNQ